MGMLCEVFPSLSPGCCHQCVGVNTPIHTYTHTYLPKYLHTGPPCERAQASAFVFLHTVGVYFFISFACCVD